MRKILLGTTAVVAAALMGPVAQAQTTLNGYNAGEPRSMLGGVPTRPGVPGSEAAAGTFGVRVGGYFEFTGGWINDTYDRNAVAVNAGNTRSRDKMDFRSDAEIVVIANGKTAGGLAYGLQIELQIDNIVNAGGAGAGTAVDTDELWGYVSSPTMGTLMFGDQDSAASQMAIGPSGPLNLDQSGSWDEFVALAADGNRYIVANINDGNDSSKVIYLSPQFAGFDFGVSFAPNRREGEEFRNAAGTSLQRDPTDSARNELSAAIRYRGSFSGIGVAAGLAGHRMDAQAVSNAVGSAQLQDITEYQAGASLSGFGFTLAGNYRWGKYGAATATAIRQGLASSSNYAVSLQYATGPYAVGAFYARGERDNGGTLADRTETVYGVGASYLLAPGMELFANYTNVKDRNMAINTTSGSAAAIALAPVGNGPGGRDRNIDAIVVGTRITF